MNDKTPNRILLGDGTLGWTLDLRQVLRVYEIVRELGVSMEDTEAVMLAMVDAGFAAMEDK